MAIRSGRFSVDLALGVDHKIIEARKSDGMIRIFNSGFVRFKVYVDGTHFGDVNPAYSLDVANGDVVTIQSVKGGDSVTGIYDYLSPGGEVRSGRFNTANSKFADDGSQTVDFEPVIIANFDELANSSSLYYRFFNSGENDYSLYSTMAINDAPTNKISTVKKDQSLDLKLPKDPGSKGKIIWVMTDAANKHVQGSFDFLDRG